MLSELGDFKQNPILLTEVEGEQSGGGIETSLKIIALPDFYLSNSTLHKINVYTTVFVDPGSLLMLGDIVTNSLAITYSYVDKIWALLKIQIRECGDRDSLKVSIALKFFYLNANAGEVYSMLLHTEMLSMRPNSENYEDLSLERIASIVTKLDS